MRNLTEINFLLLLSTQTLSTEKSINAENGFQLREHEQFPGMMKKAKLFDEKSENMLRGIKFYFSLNGKNTSPHVYLSS